MMAAVPEDPTDKRIPPEPEADRPLGERRDYGTRGRRVQVLRERTMGAFDTRTERWHSAGLGEQVTRAEARKAMREAALFFLLLVAVLVFFGLRTELVPEYRKVVRYATAVLLIFIGWGLARSAARGFAPAMFRRMDPATAGTVGFLIRLFTILGVIFGSLAIAGVEWETLAVGGNVIAGAMLLSARPFRVADRVRLQGGMLAGQVEGTIASLGLFYMTMVSGANRILVPNSVLMNVAVIPLGEPDAVELIARFDESSITPAALQRALDEEISVPLRRAPRVELEEIDADDLLTLKITVTPQSSERGAELAGEVLRAIRAGGGEGETGQTGEHPVQRSGEGAPAD
jgi:small conductance mechanosensitive channel